MTDTPDSESLGTRPAEREAAEAAEALRSLAGQQCRWCDAPLERYEGAWACPSGCLLKICPICGHQCEQDDPCEHWLAESDADQDDGWYWAPLNLDDVPYPSSGVMEADWTEAQLADAFGEALPLYEAYLSIDADWDCEMPSATLTHELFDRLTPLLGVPVVVQGWEVSGFPGTGSGGTDYFTADPDTARERMAALLARLTEGFRLLEALAPAMPVNADAAIDDEAPDAPEGARPAPEVGGGV